MRGRWSAVTGVLAIEPTGDGVIDARIERAGAVGFAEARLLL